MAPRAQVTIRRQLCTGMQGLQVVVLSLVAARCFVALPAKQLGAVRVGWADGRLLRLLCAACTDSRCACLVSKQQRWGVAACSPTLSCWLPLRLACSVWAAPSLLLPPLSAVSSSACAM